MTIGELQKFINFAGKAIQEAVNSCPDLEKDRYITLHVSPEGDYIAWNNRPEEGDESTPALHWYYIKDEEGEGWRNFYGSSEQ